MGKILVTGATGNVGRYVCSALLDMGETVVAALSQISDQKMAQVDQRAQCVLFNFEDPSTFSSALSGVDRIFLMRPPHLGNAEDMKPFMQAMKDAKIQLVSFLSLMGVENNPVPPHHKIEKLIEQAGLAYAHVRPGFFMQNLTGAHLPEIQKNGEIFIPAGKSKCSFIDAQDIGYATAFLLAHPDLYQNTAHTLTGSESLDYNQVAEIMTRILGRTICYRKPSILRYRKHMIEVRGLDKGYVNVTVMLYLMTRLGTAKKITDDFEKLTGRKPRLFETFVKENAAVFNGIS